MLKYRPRRLARRMAAYSSALAGIAGSAHAGIVPTDLGPTGVSIPGTQFGPGTFVLDLDVDGTVDFLLEHWISDSSSYSGSHVAIRAFQQNQVFGSYSYDMVRDMPRAFRDGDVISSGLPVASSLQLFVFVGDLIPFRAGPFLRAPLGRAFLGLRFEIDGQMHLGWADVQARGGPATIFGYAYETEPGKPILAGAVPEPPSLVLLAAGAAGLAALRRHRG